jgi:hypothetical protein
MVTLTAIGMGAFWWYRYFESLKVISVSAHTAGLTEFEPPSEVRVQFGDEARQVLETKKAIQTRRLEQAKASKQWNINRILSQPLRASVLSTEALLDCGVDLDALKIQLQSQLADDTISLDRKIHTANLMVKLNDRRGLDWMLSHLRSDNSRSSNGYEFIALQSAPLDWLDGEDVWTLIRPRSIEDRFDYQRKAAQRLCPHQWYDFYLAKLRDSETDLKWRIEMARWFHYANPTLEALQASEFLFEPPGENYRWGYHPYHLFLQKYFEVDDPEITKLATQYAKPLSLDRHQFSRAYFSLLAKHGDETCDDFFRSHLDTPLLKNRAFVALADRSDDPTGEFWKAIKANSPFAREALRQLQFRLAGSGDEKLAKHFRNQLKTSSHSFTKMQALLGLLQLDAKGAIDDYQKLHEEFPTKLDSPQQLVKLVDLLQENGIGRDLNKSQLIVETMRTRNNGAPFLEDDHIALAIKKAGLYHNIDMLISAERQLKEFEAMSRGDLKLGTFTAYHQRKAVAFELNGKVYEFNVAEPDIHYDPHILADVLNSILKRLGNSNRFIAHDTETSDSYFFYGPPPLARKLRDDFGFEFMPGTEAYLDEGK